MLKGYTKKNMRVDTRQPAYSRSSDDKILSLFPALYERYFYEVVSITAFFAFCRLGILRSSCSRFNN